jgi:hypothetical protein
MANCAQWDVLEISMTTPMIYQKADPEIVYFLPNLSEIGAEIKQPSSVPMDMRPTMVPCLTALNLSPSANLAKKLV